MENVYARLMAHKLGREPTQEEIDEANRIQDEAINLSSGVMGTVSGPALNFKKIRQLIDTNFPSELSMAEKIKQAAAKTSVKTPEGGLTEGVSMYQKGTQPGDDIAARLREFMSRKNK